MENLHICMYADHSVQSCTKRLLIIISVLCFSIFTVRVVVRAHLQLIWIENVLNIAYLRIYESTVRVTLPLVLFKMPTASSWVTPSKVCPFTAMIWSPRFRRPSSAAAPWANTRLGHMCVTLQQSDTHFLGSFKTTDNADIPFQIQSLHRLAGLRAGCRTLPLYWSPVHLVLVLRW